MRTHGEAVQLERREFLRNLPGHLLQKISAVAKEGMLALSPKAEPETIGQNLIARVDISRCHAWSGMICQQCYLACPKRDQAIEMRDQKPIIIASVCDGCAMCVTACETVNDLSAIRRVVRGSFSTHAAFSGEEG